jgi:hypothetical protein
MQAQQATTLARDQVLVDEVHRSPVDEYLEKTRMRILVTLLAIGALLLVLAYFRIE